MSDFDELWNEISESETTEQDKYNEEWDMKSYACNLVESSTYDHDRQELILQEIWSATTKDEVFKIIDKLKVNQLSQVHEVGRFNEKTYQKEHGKYTNS